MFDYGDDSHSTDYKRNKIADDDKISQSKKHSHRKRSVILC